MGHRITEPLGPEGPLETNLIPLLHAGLPTAGCSGLHSVWFRVSPQMEIPQYLCAGIAPVHLSCMCWGVQGWSQHLCITIGISICLLAWLCLVLPECFKGAGWLKFSFLSTRIPQPFSPELLSFHLPSTAWARAWGYFSPNT